VVGLGKSGLAAATLLRRVGAQVRVTEGSDTEAVRAARRQLATLGMTEVELGRHSRKLIEASEALVVSPGVPESAAPVRWALACARPILSEIELAFLFCPAPIVAVTGTNGKSTAVTLITEVLQAARRGAMACGNLGRPFSSVVEHLTAESIAIVEVSSFQLAWCEQFRPRIGVLLNLGTNHLDRHHHRSTYLAAKARLFQRQTPKDWAVLNGGDPHSAALGEQVRARRVWFGCPRPNPPRLGLAPGTLRSVSPNAQAVLQVGRLLDVPDPLIWQVIRAFRGLEHRLESVRTVRGVRFVNDSKSTTPESLLFALQQTRGEIVVIAGGRDKGLDFTPLAQVFGDIRMRGLVLIGESRARLRAAWNGRPNVREAETLAQAVQEACALAEPGTTVLFSPACASFDMFRDFEERGQAFKALVHHLP
jgi:UDP-N-acetylmuramoylalanine--D-glutamate ligase